MKEHKCTINTFLSYFFSVTFVISVAMKNKKTEYLKIKIRITISELPLSFEQIRLASYKKIRLKRHGTNSLSTLTF